MLGVSVTQRAVDGAATRAVLVAVAKALGVRRGDVRLVAGATSRTKILEIRAASEDDAAAVQARWEELLGA